MFTESEKNTNQQFVFPFQTGTPFTSDPEEVRTTLEQIPLLGEAKAKLIK